MDEYVNFVAAELFAEVSGMNAENMQRQFLGKSMIYNDQSYFLAIERYQKLVIGYFAESNEFMKTPEEKIDESKPKPDNLYVLKF